MEKLQRNDDRTAEAQQSGPEHDPFPPAEVNEIWPELLRAASVEVARRDSREPQEREREELFLQDMARTTRTKMAQLNAYQDFFTEELEKIFRDAPIPRLGAATRPRSQSSFEALDEAVRECAPLGSRYCIVLMAVRRAEYRIAEGGFLTRFPRRLQEEALFAMGIRADESLLPDQVRISILTA